MSRGDLKAVLGVGVGVGILIQPILANNIPPQYAISFGLRCGVLVFFTLLAPFLLYVAKWLSRIFKGLYQFAQFCAVGTLNSFVDAGVFNLETFFYGSTVSNTTFIFFKTISFLCATTNSYVWNKYWTFSAREKPKASEVTAFYTVAIIGGFLNVGVATLVKISGPADSKIWVNIVSVLAGIAAAFLWDFFGYKHFVFKKHPVTNNAQTGSAQ